MSKTNKVSKTKVSKPKAPTKPKNKKVVETPDILEVKLVSYTVQATIPTMAYGNIQPTITVEARTMEDAKRAVMPHIEELYQTYAEAPRDGSSRPIFARKASVTSTEKVVSQPPANNPETIKAPEAPAKSVKPAVNTDEEEAPAPHSAAFLKAENAIKATQSKDALDMIEGQIQKSEKISEHEKPMLLTLVIKKRKELN